MQVGGCIPRVKCLTRNGVRGTGERTGGAGWGEKNEGEDGWGELTKTKEIREIHMEAHYFENSS